MSTFKFEIFHLRMQCDANMPSLPTAPHDSGRLFRITGTSAA
jgi:hypothetical protein